MTMTTRWSRIRRFGKTLVRAALVLLVVGVILGSAFEYRTRQQVHRAYPPRGQLVDIGGRRLHLDCRGEGSPTVILESGLDTAGSLSWDRVHDPIAKITRTCAYDRAGVRWSDAKSGPQDADAVADDLHAMLTAAGITGPLVLVCHSLGGPYLMDFTRRYGDNVKGLVFVDCSHADQMERLTKFPKADEVPFAYRAMNALAFTGVARLLPPNAPEHMAERDAQMAIAYLPETMGGSLKEMQAIRTTLREAGELRDLGARPLVVLTAMQPYPAPLLASIGLSPEDGLAMQQEWEKLGFDEASWSRHSRHESIADSQHYIQLQRPDRVIAAVQEVVDAVRAGGAAMGTH